MCRLKTAPTPESVVDRQAAANLVARAEIERADGRYWLVDPLFARWVREMKESVA